MKVWSLHGMGLREWRGRRGPCVSGVWSRVPCSGVDKSIGKKMPFTGNNGTYLTLVGGSNTPFPPVYLSGIRAYKVIRARVSRRHPSYRPVHHRDKAFIELFIPTPNMTQSDSGIITALHDWSRNTRFHGKRGNAIVNSLGYLALHQTHTR